MAQKYVIENHNWLLCLSGSW